MFQIKVICYFIAHFGISLLQQKRNDRSKSVCLSYFSKFFFVLIFFILFLSAKKSKTETEIRTENHQEIDSSLEFFFPQIFSHSNPINLKEYRTWKIDQDLFTTFFARDNLNLDYYFFIESEYRNILINLKYLWGAKNPYYLNISVPLPVANGQLLNKLIVSQQEFINGIPKSTFTTGIEFHLYQLNFFNKLNLNQLKFYTYYSLKKSHSYFSQDTTENLLEIGVRLH